MSQFNNFYHIIDIKNSDEKQFQYFIQINKAHEIFNGHFPNNPVTPGVCMLQIIKELTEKQTSQILRMKSAKNIKFMAIINPTLTPEILVDLNLESSESNSDYVVKSSFSFKDPETQDWVTALKFSGSFSQ